MIVCVCANISEDDIVEHAKLNRLAELYEQGMCGFCGSCRDDIEEILEDNLYNDDDDNRL